MKKAVFSPFAKIGLVLGVAFAATGAAIAGFSSKPTGTLALSSGYAEGEYHYYNGSYYNSITDAQIATGGTTLLDKLHTLIDTNKKFGYDNIWTFNEAHDCYPADYDGTDPLTGNSYPTTNNSAKRGKMWDMYCDKAWKSVTDRCGNYSDIGDKYNREHSMPKSWFGGSDSNDPGTDPNHLYNTDGKVNGIRSNYAFGEVTSVKTNCYTLNPKCIGFGKLGTNSSGNTVFEPDDAYKGDFARAQMYMATCYYDWNLSQDASGKLCFSYAGGHSTMKDYYINLLTKWSAEDPVSQKEIDRNNAVQASSMGNRNPFIDHPTWANRIWGGTTYTWNGKSSSETTAETFAASLLGKTNSVCAAGYNNKTALTPIWSQMVSEWNALSSSEQTRFTEADSSANTTLGKGAARYDYIASKYGFQNFADRSSALPKEHLSVLSGFNPGGLWAFIGIVLGGAAIITPIVIAASNKKRRRF